MKAMFLSEKKAKWKSLHRLCSIYPRRREYIECLSLWWEIQSWRPGYTSCSIPLAFKESVEYSPVWVLLTLVSPLLTSTHVGCLWEHMCTHKHFRQFILLNICYRPSHFSLIINTFPTCWAVLGQKPGDQSFMALQCSCALRWKRFLSGQGLKAVECWRELLMECKSQLNFSGILRASYWAQLF